MRDVVLGLGNVLLGDDALGPYVVRVLEARYELPAGVDLVDLGTPGLDLTPHLSGARRVIVVDTVRAKGPAGALSLYEREQVLEHLPQPRLTPHDPGLKEALLTLEFGGGAPEEFLLVGVIPESTETGVGLSAAVQGAVDQACRAVVQQLGAWGHAVPPRKMPEAPKIWWESGASPGGEES